MPQKLNSAGKPPALAKTTTLALSIILAVENNTACLKDTLKSLLAQKNIAPADCELLLIGDKTNITALKNADAIIAGRENTRSLIWEKRLTTEGKWNEGLKIAQGDYIAFIATGDVLTDSALSELYSTAAQNGADVAHPSRWYIPQPKINSHGPLRLKEYADEPGKTIHLLPDAIQKRISLLRDGQLKPYLAGKLFKRSFLATQEIAFEENVPQGADILFLIQCLYLGARYLKIPKAFYIASPIKKQNGKSWEKYLKTFAHHLKNYFSAAETDEEEALRRKMIAGFLNLYSQEHILPYFADSSQTHFKKRLAKLASEITG